jgi:hypothetical protein
MDLDELTGLLPPENYLDFYNKYFAAQQWQYEKTNGWIYWMWKTESAHLTNYLQWSYSTSSRKEFNLQGAERSAGSRS